MWRKIFIQKIFLKPKITELDYEKQFSFKALIEFQLKQTFIKHLMWERHSLRAKDINMK